MKDRIEWIDVLKCFCIFLVIACHWEGCPTFLSDFFGPFFLVCFFFASGYCFNYQPSLKKHIYKKFRTLFVPWFIFSYVNILLSRVISWKEHKNFIYELIMNAVQIRGVEDKLWFIACLFIAFIPYYFVIKKYKQNNKNSQKILFFLIFVSTGMRIFKLILRINEFDYIWGNTNLPWHLDYIGEVNLYMYLGYLFKERYEKIFDINNTRTRRFILFVVYLIIIYVPNILRLDKMFIIEEILDIISIFVGTVFAIAIFKTIRINRFFKFVGMNTLVYFSWHNKAETLLEVILNKLLGTYYEIIINNSIYSLIFTIILVILVSVVLIIPTMIINKYFYFILGKKKECVY